VKTNTPSRCAAQVDSNPLRPVGSIAQQIVADLAFQRRLKKLHALGPRAVGEFIAELAAKTGSASVMDDQLDNYLRLDPQVVMALGADRFPPFPLHEVPR